MVDGRIAALCLMMASPALAGPPLDPPPPGKRPAPLVVPATCSNAYPPSLSPQAILDELRRGRMRGEELRAAQQALDQERAALAEEKERLELERLELELLRDELRGGPLPAPSAAPAATASLSADEVQKLSATVKAMRPAAAAPAIAKLDPALAAEVLRSLSRPAAAAVLEQVPAELAADLMSRLARPRPTGEN